MPKFEITKPGQTLDDISRRVEGSAPEFANDSVSVTRIGTTKAPITKVSTEKALSSKKEKADALREKRDNRLSVLTTIVEELTQTKTDIKNQFSLYQALVNTPLSELLDLTQVDLTTLFPIEVFDFDTLGLPTPQSAGLVLSDIINLSNVDLSNADLPQLRFGKLTGTTWVLADLIDELNLELKTIDLRHAILPVLDYSNSAFDGWVWSTDVERDNVWLRHVVDLSNVDLSSVIDTSLITTPLVIEGEEITLPNYIDVSSYTDSLTALAKEMGDDGDLFGLVAFYEKLTQVDLLGEAFVNSVLTPFIVKALMCFKVPGYKNGDKLPKSIKDKVSNALTVLPKNWLYISGTKHYNYDNLLRVNPWVLESLKDDNTYHHLYQLVSSY